MPLKSCSMCSVRVVTHLVDGVVDELLDVDLSVVCVGGEQYSNEKVETTVLLKS